MNQPIRATRSVVMDVSQRLCEQVSLDVCQAIIEASLESSIVVGVAHDGVSAILASHMLPAWGFIVKASDDRPGNVAVGVTALDDETRATLQQIVPLLMAFDSLFAGDQSS